MYWSPSRLFNHDFVFPYFVYCTFLFWTCTHFGGWSKVPQTIPMVRNRQGTLAASFPSKSDFPFNFHSSMICSFLTLTFLFLDLHTFRWAVQTWTNNPSHPK